MVLGVIPAAQDRICITLDNQVFEIDDFFEDTSKMQVCCCLWSFLGIHFQGIWGGDSCQLGGMSGVDGTAMTSCLSHKLV